MSDHAALIEEARIGTGGYSESELRWLGKQLADALEAAEARNTDALAKAWDEGWDAGNYYAISEPFDNRDNKSQNPYRNNTRGHA